jgi:hypothetical protein
MKFGEWWSEGDEFEPAAQLPLCEDGQHTGTIAKAEFKDLKFKVSDRNPSGTSLVVKVSVPNHQAVESIAPVQFRGQIEAICRAARVNTPDPNEDWDVTQLVGQVVVIETVFGIGKTGREYVRIDRWHPGPDPLPALKAPARTPAARIAAAGQGGISDDIPF